MIAHKLSQPATRVEAEHELTTMRFSRSLDERSPFVRSGSAWIVPMEDDLQREFDWSTYAIAFVLVMVLGLVIGGAL